MKSQGRTHPRPARRATIPIEHSKLYGQRSRKRLMELLGWSGDLNSLEQFARRKDNYRPFAKKKPNGKERMIEPPKPALMKLHKQVFRYLRDVETPAYLHSGVRKKSYVTNARAHAVAPGATITMDLADFYAGTKWGHLFLFFHENLKCSRDLSGLLARLCCYEGHLPTGSPVSQTLAFFAHHRMFDEISHLVAAREGVLTVYVDDLTITMRCASRNDVETVRDIVERHGLTVNTAKTHVYRARSAKPITGLMLVPHGIRASHAKHQKLQLLRSQCNGPDTSPELLQKLVGTLEHLALLDERLAPALRAEAKGLRRLVATNTAT